VGTALQGRGDTMTAHTADRIRELRERADELRNAAGSMRFRDTRVDLVALAESYDRLADELDSPLRSH